jgi:hypothetical protein
MGYGLTGACASPITGAEGNREFFLHLARDGAPMAGTRFESMIEEAVKA